jgi:site-specific recombinase XerD
MNTTFNLELNGKAGQNGLHEVFLRITQNRKHKRLKLGISVKKADFNRKAKHGKWIRQKNSDYASINAKLRNKYDEAIKNFNELEKKKQSLSLHSIKQKIVNPETSHSFFAFAKNQLNLLSTSKQKSYSFEKHFRSVIFKGEKSKNQNNLQSYAESKGFDDLLFSDITYGFLKDYESFLSGQGNKTNTIHKKMGFFKALYKEAIKRDLIKPEDYPFLKYDIKKTPVSKDKLTQEEISKIEKLQLPEGSLICNSRNMFLFSFYQAGIRASDCIKLTWGNVIEGRLIYCMDKNEKPLNLKIMPKAEEILNLYRWPGARAKDYIFPLLDSRKDFSDRIFLFNQVSSKNALINKNLRKIAKQAGIEKKVSFHISRHSFASIAKNEKKLSTEMISELLNHSSVSTTKAYLKGFPNDDLDNSLESVTGGGTAK